MSTESPSGLTYDPFTDTYTHVWNPTKGWKGTCRELAIGLDDNAHPHSAHVQFM